MSAPSTIQEHMVSLGFSVDQVSYARTTNALDNLNTLVSHFASRAKAKFAEAALSVLGFEQALKKIHAPHMGAVGGTSGGGSSSGNSGGPAAEFAKVEKGAKKAGTGVQQFAVLAVKYFGEASVAFAGLASAVAGGTVSMLNGLGNQEIQMQMLARTMWTTQRQAYAFSLTLKALGANLQDLYLSPTLMAQYQKLHAVALQMQTPGNYNAEMGLIQGVSLQIKQMKLEANYALQWIGYYFIKYMQGPISKVQAVLQAINGQIIHNMPTWTRKVAAVMASFMQAGIYIVQALGNVYSWLVKMLAYMPGWARGIVAAFALINVAVAVSPFGRFLMMLTGVVLVFDDFVTYLHGGKSALGAFGAVLLGVIGVFATYKTALLAIAAVQAIWDGMLTVGIVSLYAWDAAVAVGKGAMLAWSAVVQGAADIMAVFDAVMVANPIGVLIVVLGVLAVLLYKIQTHWLQIELVGLHAFNALGAAAISAWNAIVSGAKRVWTWFTHLGLGAQALIAAVLPFVGIPALIVANWRPISAFFDTLWTGVQSAGVNAWNAIFGAAKGAINWIIGALNDVIAVMDVIPGVHIKPLTPFSTVTAGLPRGAPSAYAYHHPHGAVSVAHKHVTITQHNHIHGSGSPEATAHAVGRTFNRGIHSVRGVIG